MTPVLLTGSEIVVYRCDLGHRHIFREKAERCDRVARKRDLWARRTTTKTEVKP